MPLFACSRCRCVENTAHCHYWIALAEARAAGREPAPLCSACDPDIGAWHGRFDRRSAVGLRLDHHGHLWMQGAVVPANCRIVGTVEA